MPRITQLYAFVMSDTDDDDEGVPAFLGPGASWMPLMGADEARIESLRSFAQDMCNQMGKEFRLMRSTGLELIDTLRPEENGR